MTLPAPPSWMADALCGWADADLWFPEPSRSSAPAKRICNGTTGRPPCPVKADCLTHALANGERYGTWGGLSERERAPLHKATGRPPRTQPHKRQPRRLITDDQRQQIRDLTVINGLSIRDISRKLGISEGSVSRVRAAMRRDAA